MRRHPDTERALLSLVPGETVLVHDGGVTLRATFVEHDLDGVVVRWLDGTTATLTVAHATAAQYGLPADLVVAS